MPGSVKLRLVLPVLLAALAAFAGCGGGSDDGSGAAPATLAPADAPVFVEATLQPEGELQKNVEALAQQLAGVDDLGGLIVSELEASADSSQPVDFETEIEPWLGERAGMFLESYDGDDFHGYGIAVAVSDADAAREFVAKRAETDDGEPFEKGSEDGVDYWVDPDDGTVAGVVGDFVAIAEGLASFKRMLAAEQGESLAGQDRFAAATEGAPSGSLGDVYVDIGGLIREAGGAIDPDAERFFDSAGIDPREATALASVIPGPDRLEVDVSSDLGGQNPPGGDASELLGSLPAGAVGALASADFGERLGEAIDELDAAGVPGEIPPHQLKKTMKAAGVDLGKISGSLGDLALFVEGGSRASLGGAVIVETDSPAEARGAVADVGLLLRASETPGVTAIGGRLSGFSVRSEDLGSKPLVVVAGGAKIAISYGRAAAARALAPAAATLASDPAFEAGAKALGDTPISGFVAGRAALRLARALLPADDRRDLQEARPYLRKIEYLALGGGASGERSTAKIVAGLDR